MLQNQYQLKLLWMQRHIIIKAPMTIKFDTYFAKDIKHKRELRRRKLHVDTNLSTLYVMYDTPMSKETDEAYIVSTAFKNGQYIGIVVIDFIIDRLPITHGYGNIFVQERYRNNGIARLLFEHVEQKVLEAFGDKVTVTGAHTFNVVAKRSLKVLKVH